MRTLVGDLGAMDSDDAKPRPGFRHERGAERPSDPASDAMGSIRLRLNRVATVVFGLDAVGFLIFPYPG